MSIPKYLILDLDNTLYPKSSGLDEAMRLRILSYLVVKQGLTEKEAADARDRYVKAYGLSLPGIMKDFDVDIADYQAYIHEVDVASFIKANPELQKMLSKLPFQRIIYTNSSKDHTRRVLNALGVDQGLFSHVVDFRSAGCFAKPMLESFNAMLGIIGASGEDCIMVDDMPKTVRVAKKQFGMRSVLIDEDGRGGCEEADWSISRINELGEVLNSLFEVNDCLSRDGEV